MTPTEKQLQYALDKIVGTNKGTYMISMYSALMCFFDTSPSCLMSVDEGIIIVQPKDREKLIHELEEAIGNKDVQKYTTLQDIHDTIDSCDDKDFKYNAIEFKHPLHPDVKCFDKDGHLYTPSYKHLSTWSKMLGGYELYCYVEGQEILDFITSKLNKTSKEVKREMPNEPNLTRPPHYENEGNAQIWDYFHFLDGIQANVLKYLDRAGKKQSAKFAHDISKAIAYANKGASLGELQKATYCPFALLAKIIGNIDTFKDVEVALVASAVLHGNYKFAVKKMEEWI